MLRTKFGLRTKTSRRIRARSNEWQTTVVLLSIALYGSTSAGSVARHSLIILLMCRLKKLKRSPLPMCLLAIRYFLSVALGWAEVLGADAIFVGANAVDYSGYPDCRPEYLEAFQTMANLATKAGVEGARY